MVKRISSIAVLGLVVLGLMAAEGCCKKAEEKIKSAETAIAQAKEADAGTYAQNDLSSAEEGLTRARNLCKRGQCKKGEEEADMALAQAKLAQETAENAKAAEQASNTSMNQPVDTKSNYLQDVTFDYDSAKLSLQAKSVMFQNATYLRRNPHIKIRIEGHCDDRGSREYNKRLGARRAMTVVNYLISEGVDPSRIEAVTYGESLPADPGENEAAWAANRRVHIEQRQ